MPAASSPLPKFRQPDSHRSKNMAAIHSRDTSPEMYVRRALHGAGFRFRLHVRQLPGTPDIVLTRYKTAVFVNGCYWHGHACKRDHRPTTNSEYWREKIARNVARDQHNQVALREEGWRVEVVWECELSLSTSELVSRLSHLRRDAALSHIPGLD